MERRELPERRLLHMDVEGLALVDKRPSGGCHVDKVPLLDLPNRLVDGLEPADVNAKVVAR